MSTAGSSPLLSVVLFSALCAVATWFVLQFVSLPFQWQHVVMLAYFAGMSLLLHIWQERAVTEPRTFVRRFMAGLVIKLLLSIIVMMILVLALGVDKSSTIVAFVLLYLAYLGFSTGRLVMLLKQRG